MTNFQPYYHQDIYENINTQQEHDLVTGILSITDVYQLQAEVTDYLTRRNLDPTYRQTREHHLRTKAIQKCQSEVIKRQSAFSAKCAPFVAVASIMEGMILGDEWSNRF